MEFPWLVRVDEKPHGLACGPGSAARPFAAAPIVAESKAAASRLRRFSLASCTCSMNPRATGASPAVYTIELMRPPSSRIAAPLVAAASGLARKATMSAISSASIMR
jgi:hypothetical protein